MVWIAIKLQTTGLVIGTDQVVSIAASAEGSENDFYSIVHATCTSSPAAEKVHKVSRDEIQRAAAWGTVVRDQFVPWVHAIEPDPSKITFFAHNGDKFDFPMLRREHVAELEPYLRSSAWYDTLKITESM